MINLDLLNEHQREAVTYTEGPLLILAGAGSGKTKALTSRIAYLIYEKKIAPWHILAITFTNKAAQEMRERIVDLIGSEGQKVWASTFHSTCVRILRAEIEHLGYDRNFVIYDDGDQQTLLKMVLKELNVDDKKLHPRTVASQISKYKNELQSPKEAKACAKGDFVEEKTAEIYSLYQERLLKNNAVDFDDLIMLTVLLFKESPEILEKYQERFLYILVDEYQDTNTSQYELVRLLAEKYKNLCVVGDDDQSIYQWRGADIRNILNFEKDYPDAKVVKLEENYRSTQFILDAAHGVVKHNVGRRDKKLWTNKEGGEKIIYYTAMDESDEAFFVTRQIRQIKDKEERKSSDFAILCRATAQFRMLEESLIKQGIPYRIFGGTKFYGRKEIKDILAYLKAVINPADEVSVERSMGTPKRGIGETSWNRLVQYANSRYLPIGDALLEAADAGVGKKYAQAMAQFGQQLSDFRALSQEVDVTTLTKTILEESGYIQELEAEETVEATTRLENLQEFLSITQNFDAKSIENGGSLATFLGEVTLFTDLDNYGEDDDQVTIMTMHGAKGLEFPVVFLVGMEEQVFPHARSINSLEPEEMEEERRLCYVALTRAKEKIILTRATSRMLYGRTNHNAPSRFIDEIPGNIVDNLNARTIPKQVNPFSVGLHGFVEEKKAPVSHTHCDKDDFVLGETVLHKKWGEGVIVAKQGEGEDLELKVAFPEQGIKNLIAKYAPISKC